MPDESRVPREALRRPIDRHHARRRGFRRPRRRDLRRRRAGAIDARGCARACSGCMRRRSRVGDAVTCASAPPRARGTVALIDNAVDPGKLVSTDDAVAIAQNHVGEIEIALTQPIAADIYALNPRTGRIVLEFAGRIAGGGLILRDRRRRRRRRRVARRSARRWPSASIASCAACRRPSASRASARRSTAGSCSPRASGWRTRCSRISLREAGSRRRRRRPSIPAGCFRETYDLWAETERRYGRRIRAIYPRTETLEALVAEQGINGFYDSRAGARCPAAMCARSSRSIARSTARAAGSPACAPTSRRNRAASIWSASTPSAACSSSTRCSTGRARRRSASPAHNRSRSIRCTRRASCRSAARRARAPIAPGEPERAGRWWWEDEDKKECGLHVGVDGRLVRTAA